jgi:DNA repair protein RecO (recombination protein O)
MAILQSDALVLRAYKLGETSKIVTLLSRAHGKLRAVAKGARNPRSRYQSALELMSEVRVSLYGRQGTELFRLGACELVHSAFPLATRSLESGMAVSYFADLLDSFSSEGVVEDALYRLAPAVLHAAEEGVPLPLLSRYLEAWLLKLHGLYPQLERCASCNQPLPAGPLAYHRPAHGFICDACGPASGPRLGESQRAVLVAIFRTAPDALLHDMDGELAGLDTFHQSLINEHLERALRSQRVLSDVARETHH